MTMRLGDHTITILRAGFITDEYGQPSETRDWDHATQAAVSGCSVQPADTTENTFDRDAVTVRYRVFIPGSVDLKATDRVEFKDVVYDVDGDPQDYDFPPLQHTTALLRRTEG